MPQVPLFKTRCFWEAVSASRAVRAECGVWCRESIKCQVWQSSRSGWLGTGDRALQTRVWSHQMALDRCFLFMFPIPFSFSHLPSFTCHIDVNRSFTLCLSLIVRSRPPDPCRKSDSLASAGPAFWAPPLGCPVGSCISAHSSGHPGLKPENDLKCLPSFLSKKPQERLID